MAGGPAPYHVSVCISFFSKTGISDELQKIFSEEAVRPGVSVHEQSTQAEQAADGDAEPAPDGLRSFR